MAALLASEVHVVHIEARLAVALARPVLAVLLLVLTLSATPLTSLKSRNESSKTDILKNLKDYLLKHVENITKIHYTFLLYFHNLMYFCHLFYVF